MPPTIVRDEHASVDALAIVEKYEAFLNYVYQIVENCPRKHRAAWRRAGDIDRLERFVPGWLGHARFADSRNLIRSFALEAA